MAVEEKSAEDLLAFTREVQPDGRVWFRRRSQILQVWALNTCRRKVEDAIGNQKVKELFEMLSAVLGGYGHGCDQLLFSWFSECFANMELAYDEICGAPAELPDTDELPDCDEELELPEADEELPEL